MIEDSYTPMLGDDYSGTWWGEGELDESCLE